MPDSRAEGAIEFMRTNLSAALSVELIATGVGLSSSRLAHLFKLDVGISLMSYTRQRRIELAQELLQSTSKPLKEIAFEVGMPDVRHFGKVFRQVCRYPPSSRRNRD